MKKTILPGMLVSLEQTVVFRSMEEDGILVNMGSGSVYSTNSSATFLIRAIQNGERTVASLVEELVEIFSVEKETASAEVSTWVSEMIDRGFVRCA